VGSRLKDDIGSNSEVAPDDISGTRGASADMEDESASFTEMNS
jgi:hypothetical protein